MNEATVCTAENTSGVSIVCGSILKKVSELRKSNCQRVLCESGRRNL